ncbi:MAG: uncharacterized protein QG632_680 [Candidatus Dependentiae bacterium]|nr:uncharacterized protein [Candidatus Dependentiae bacterium]
MSQHRRPFIVVITLTLSLLSAAIVANKIEPEKVAEPMDASAQQHYVNALLHKYHLAPNDQPFSYKFKYEIYSPILGKYSCQLPAEIENIALQQNSYLQNTTYYRDFSLLQNPAKVRALQLKTAKDGKESGSTLSAVTSDGIVIEGTLLNRNSSTLLVVGAGFTNYREQMAPMGDLFSDYDVLFYDYRGHGFKERQWHKPKTWRSPSEILIGIDRKTVRLGLSEEKDVFAIVSQACRMKKYTNVVGLGLCYSGLILIKTAALHPNLFTKLIVDGCWFSLRDAVDILSKDPGMMPRPQRHSKWEHNWLVQQRWFQKSVVWLAERIFNLDFNTVSVLDYAPLLRENMPILFIHGKDDIMIPREKFEILFHATNCRQKTAFITDIPHVWNHLKAKELYKEVIETFINMPYEHFNRLMISPEAMIDYKQAKLLQGAGGNRSTSGGK